MVVESATMHRFTRLKFRAPLLSCTDDIREYNIKTESVLLACVAMPTGDYGFVDMKFPL